MFIGGFSHTLDKKGRVVLPSRFREVIKEKYIDSFIMTKWMDSCLCLFPIKEWKTFEQELNGKPKGDNNVRPFNRLLYASAIEVVVDKQGRIFIPIHLRTLVGIDRDLFILGHSNRIEIWSKKNWEEYSRTTKPLEEYAQELSKLGV